MSDLASPGQIERRVGDNSIQPRPERLRGVEPIKRLIRAQKPFLHRILGVLVCQDDRSRHDVRSPLVQTHKARETSLVPLFGQTYELSLLVRNTYGCVQLLTGW